MGAVARFGVGVEILGTLGHRDHPRDPRLPSRPGLPVHHAGRPARRDQPATASTSTEAGSPRPSWRCSRRSTSSTASSPRGDIAEETKDAGRQIPKAMRYALIWGGVASLILTGALLLAMPKHEPGRGDGRRRRCPVHPRPALERDAGLPAPPDHLRVLLLRDVRAGRGQQARLLVRPGRRTARFRLDLPGERAVPDSGERVAHRRRDLTAVRVPRLLLAEPQRRPRVHHVPGEHQRAPVARLLRRQRHLSLVPADCHRSDDRPAPRLGAGGQLPAREVGLDRVHHRGALSRPDAAQRRSSDGADERSRPVQLRLAHAPRDGDHRGRRRDLLLHRAAGSQRRAAPGKHAAARRRRSLRPDLRGTGRRRRRRPVRLFV